MFVALACSYGEKGLRVCVYFAHIHAKHTRTTRTHTNTRTHARTSKTQLFDLRGENSPTTSSDSRMRADEHRSHRGIPRDAPIHACRDVAPVHALPRTRLLPSGPCYCCDLMKCYARSPAITFPLHRLTPYSVGLVSRSGTLGHLSSLTIPGATASIGDFCILLKGIPISYESIGRA